ncbi:MAG: ThiF family adenylyltransferase [Alphaproteobacteria bacterium]|nr:ThiF family adenylyltransferase [Alphaproteobacteria bacterium]MBU1516560.1 ThiF family adenylyltransferase [Alphaproteobacteria bacterium]MBU2094317.1 ThiF family adenylyltransferase [Alphaproteobacteria bacterium]MBU2154106.1 ThiF family adenylyltransferase [Alphaproteobacteria bacterium]MBU2307487.1 ThiF family adenylyltransferase [Alphaproteobacteria bacterium]
MIWWSALPARARDERAHLAELAERVDWLDGVTWKIDGVRLLANFLILVGDTYVPLTLRYPDYFPDVPPSISPTEDVRLSGHQWGKGGELCLEYRADNWVPTITGAMMVESAHRLLSGEDGEDVPPVPSAHRATLGQEVRSSFVRFALSAEAEAALKALPEGEITEAVLVEHKFGETWVGSLGRLGPKDSVLFTGPPALEGATNYDAIAYRVPKAMPLLTKFNDETLPLALEMYGLGEWLKAAREKKVGFAILITDTDVVMPSFFVGEKFRALDYQVVRIPLAEPRLPKGYDNMASAVVGIVGCGSVGSKLAASLARSGVSNFLLLDTDVFLPGNIVRNELDLRAVAVNKTKALKHRITEINADASVQLRTILFGGQESAENTASAMAALAKCDVVIDATADADVFNLCAAVTKAERKPLIWGQVFGGGVGGLIAMARPDIDPPPQLARNQILGWYADQGVPWDLGIAAGGYDAERGSGPPLIASDAEVGIIAAHLAQMVVDRLLVRSPSGFDSPAYVLGFKAEWIFQGPFDTYPIQYIAEGVWGPAQEANVAEDLTTFLSELYPEVEGEG